MISPCPAPRTEQNRLRKGRRTDRESSVADKVFANNGPLKRNCRKGVHTVSSLMQERMAHLMTRADGAHLLLSPTNYWGWCCAYCVTGHSANEGPRPWWRQRFRSSSDWLTERLLWPDLPSTNHLLKRLRCFPWEPINPGDSREESGISN